MNGTNEARTILDELQDRRREAWQEWDEAAASVEDVEEQIARIEGDPVCAEWHRLRAVAMRNRTPDNAQAADRAWLVMTATRHLKSGTRPDMGSRRQNEIDELCDELSRGEGH
jgi:hypothetical protein